MVKCLNIRKNIDKLIYRSISTEDKKSPETERERALQKIRRVQKQRESVTEDQKSPETERERALQKISRVQEQRESVTEDQKSPETERESVTEDL